MDAQRDRTDTAASGGASGQESKRAQILTGARRIFRARGFDGASMGDIAKAAGVSKGTLYVYFASKEALFEALVLEDRREAVEQVVRLDDDDPDVRSALRHLGRSFVAMMVRSDHIAVARMVMGAAEKFPRVGRVFYEAGPLYGAERLAKYFDRQVAAGRLAIADTTLAAWHFVEMCQGDIVKALYFGATAPPTSKRIEDTVEAALEVFFAAYGAKRDRT